ncbi:hypothetical protein [Humibacillus xanthopallidus]|uniref:Phage protein D n=1 Tax=Humibacillus xanthopallidus TaxID=412689 RepID=A0A543HUK3_9MICO|nr:hypothetical protein [Humibacillus xanthopallidus]TQM61944.1 hypothetical protein FBY41_1966 [Humibacillus xanthopallidus]
MASLSRPRYELRIGALTSTDSIAAGGPGALVVEREIDVPLDLARLRLTDRSDISVGDDCTLALGLGTTPERVFTGTVVEVRADVWGATVVAAGAMTALLDLRVTATYTRSSVGSIARDLAGRAGLSATDVAEGPTLPRFVLDARRGAHGQLRELAARFGLEVYADRRGALVIRAVPGGGPARGAVGGLGGFGGAAAAVGVAAPGSAGAGPVRHGAEVLAATGRRRPPAWDAVSVGGESPASTKGSKAADWLTSDDDASLGEAGRGDRRLLTLDPLARTKDLARDLADGTLQYAGRHVRLVEVVVPGRPGTELGDSLEIGSAAGADPDGLVTGSGTVRGLRHRLDGIRGYTTSITVALPPPGEAVG